jgi:flagellar basal body-associated protein FliL
MRQSALTSSAAPSKEKKKPLMLLAGLAVLLLACLGYIVYFIQQVNVVQTDTSPQGLAVAQLRTAIAQLPEFGGVEITVDPSDPSRVLVSGELNSSADSEKIQEFVASKAFAVEVRFDLHARPGH